MKAHIPSFFTLWVNKFKNASDFTFPFSNIKQIWKCRKDSVLNSIEGRTVRCCAGIPNSHFIFQLTTQIIVHQETILPPGNFCTRTNPNNLRSSCHYAVWSKFVLSSVSHKKNKIIWESYSKKSGKQSPGKCEYKTQHHHTIVGTQSQEQFRLEGTTVCHLVQSLWAIRAIPEHMAQDCIQTVPK